MLEWARPYIEAKEKLREIFDDNPHDVEHVGNLARIVYDGDEQKVRKLVGKLQ